MFDKDLANSISKKINPNYPFPINENDYKSLSETGMFPFVRIGDKLCMLFKRKESQSFIQTENGFKGVKKGQDFLLVAICDFFKIRRKIFWSDESSPPNIEVEFLDKRVIYDYGLAIKSGIELLTSNGVVVNNRHIDNILDYIYRELNNAPIEYKHKMLGFCDIDRKQVFRHYKLISESNKIIQSTYDSNNDVFPHGKYEEWLDMVNTEVHGNPKMELILAIALSAAVIGFLGKAIPWQNTIFQLVGDSSSGKSTAMALAVSVYSSPKISQGLMKTFNATDNSIQKCMERNNSVVVGFDEGGMNKRDYANLIYTLSSGTSKMRLNGDGEFKEINTWNNICMTTSEFNLLEQSDSKTGLSVRCIEIPAPFTTSADNSNRIKQCIEENYAVAVEPFIKELFSLDKESIISTYKECYDEMFSLHKKAVRCGSVLDERVIQTLAPIYLTAQICKGMEKGIRIRISPSKIKEQLIEISSRMCSSENSIEGKALDIIKRFIETNWISIEYPYDKEIDRFDKRGIIARIRKFSDEWFFEMYKANFDELMRKNGLSPIVVKRRLKELKILHAEKGRLEKRLKFNNNNFAIPCIQLSLPYEMKEP